MKKIVLILPAAISLMWSACSSSAERSRNRADVEEPGGVETVAVDPESEYVDEKDGYWFTELGVACREGNLETVKKWIAKEGVEAEAMADEIFVYGGLLTAVRYGQSEIVRYLIDAGADVNRICDESGWTPLTEACSLTDPEKGEQMARWLLDAGANPDGAGDLGFDYVIYPLQVAGERGNEAVVRLLLERGADVTKSGMWKVKSEE